jgi:hypothetical protein
MVTTTVVEPAVQSITVPSSRIDFKRGTYKIVQSPHTPKTILSDGDLIAILKQAGFKGPELKMAWAIAIKESTGRPMALNKSSNCYGLFQINMTGSMGPDRREKYNLSSNNDLYNPLINAQIAYQMSNGGKNWSAWSTENSAKRFVSEFPN